MKRLLIFFIPILIFSCTEAQNKQTSYDKVNSIQQIKMKLSAFGVESDTYPTIEVYIDFTNDSSNCVRTYFNPKYKSSSYNLSKAELQKIKELLKLQELKKLGKEYTCNLSDQPRATTTIISKNEKLVFDDYGLLADKPLKNLYAIVFKFEKLN